MTSKARKGGRQTQLNMQGLAHAVERLSQLDPDQDPESDKSQLPSFDEHEIDAYPIILSLFGHERAGYSQQFLQMIDAYTTILFRNQIPPPFTTLESLEDFLTNVLQEELSSR